MLVKMDVMRVLDDYSHYNDDVVESIDETGSFVYNSVIFPIEVARSLEAYGFPEVVCSDDRSRISEIHSYERNLMRYFGATESEIY